MKNLIDEFLFWVFLIILVFVAGICTCVYCSHKKDLEMARLGMCETPVLGAEYTKWQKCK